MSMPPRMFEIICLFPPFDDSRSAYSYGGYSMGFQPGNLLSAAHVVIVTNSIVTTVPVERADQPISRDDHA